MSVTLEDFQSLQAQLLQMKTENYNLQEQLGATKKRSALSPQQIAENLKNENIQLRVRINQCTKEREQLIDQLKLVKITQFLQNQNLYEANAVPDLQSMPQQLVSIATNVFQLMENVKQQIVRRAFLDTQVNELGKKTKSLGRTGEQLQSQIDTLRANQKIELAGVDSARETMQKLEVETSSLREAIQAAASPKANTASPEDLKSLQKKVSVLKEEIDQRKEKHNQLIESLNSQIDVCNRKLEDATASKLVIEKKMHQKIWALQAEINKRRGIVVHSSKTTSRQDSAQLFLESKRLISEIATKQQEIWELEERVTFSRHTLKLMSTDILKKMIGKLDEQKAKQMTSVGHGIILKLAEYDRKKKELLSQKGK